MGYTVRSHQVGTVYFFLRLGCRDSEYEFEEVAATLLIPVEDQMAHRHACTAMPNAISQVLFPKLLPKSPRG